MNSLRNNYVTAVKDGNLAQLSKSSTLAHSAQH